MAWSTQAPPICRVYEGQPMERVLASWDDGLKGRRAERAPFRQRGSTKGPVRIILNCKSRKATVAQSSK